MNLIRMSPRGLPSTTVGRRVLRLLPAILVGASLLCPVTFSDRVLAGQGTGGEAKAVSVEVVKPSRRTVVRELRMPATLIADEQVDLFAKTSGYVSVIDLDIGDRVSKGDVLVVIDVPEMGDELRQAEAILLAGDAKVRAAEAKAAAAQRLMETARAQVSEHVARHELDEINLQRRRELREGNAIPQQILDEAQSAHAITKAQLRIAEARVAAAEAEKTAADADVEVAQAERLVGETEVSRLKTLIEYASIKAPFDGVITGRHVDHGTFVLSAAQGKSDPLLRIAKTDRIRVVLEVPERDAPFVRVGTEVDIDVPALGGHPFPGKVSRVAGALVPETRTMRAEIDIDNAAGRLSPGMYAQVVVKLETRTHALLIPSKAIRVLGGDTFVLVAEAGEAQARPIHIGYDDGIWAEILSGLTEEELVIAASGGAVAAGSAVLPVFSGS